MTASSRSPGCWLAAHVMIGPLFAIPVAFVTLFCAGALLQPVLLQPQMGLGARQVELLTLLRTFGLEYALIDLGRVALSGTTADLANNRRVLNTLLGR